MGDIVAGWLIVVVLKSKGMSVERSLKFASIWLLNPMVATISTRGSSEGLLGVMVIALLWAITERRVVLSGVLLGLSVHFKIYPFIYAPSIIWWMDEKHLSPGAVQKTAKGEEKMSIVAVVMKFCNKSRITLTATSLLTFVLLNLIMYTM